jgi:hypothetical protein
VSPVLSGEIGKARGGHRAWVVGCFRQYRTSGSGDITIRREIESDAGWVLIHPRTTISTEKPRMKTSHQRS